MRRNRSNTLRYELPRRDRKRPLGESRGPNHLLRNFAVFALLCLIAWGAYFLLRGGGAPKLTLTPAVDVASYGTKFTLSAAAGRSGLVSLAVAAEQNGRRVELLNRTFPAGVGAYLETFTLPRSAKLADGPCTLSISAKGHGGALAFLGRGTTSLERKLTLELVPPQIAAMPGTHNLSRGGAGAISFNVSKPVVSAGVAVGQTFFPAYQQKNGTYVCYFALPYDMNPDDFHPKITVRDRAGNSAVQAIIAYVFPKTFRSDKINVPDSFLNEKMGQYASLFPAGTAPVEIYKSVNHNLRTQNVAQLLTIGRQTSANQLWSGPFLRLPNSATRAGYGDQRDYYYNGEKIDHETHLGVDLASVAGAPVPAANAGVVVQAAFFGIYGNCVIIDHGQGVMSLYSHLSEIDVRKGQTVQRGQIIAHTGATGLAGGDHLHFGILISGLQVNPVEWFDEHWIHDNILRFIGGAQTAQNAQNATAAAPAASSGKR